MAVLGFPAHWPAAISLIDPAQALAGNGIGDDGMISATPDDRLHRSKREVLELVPLVADFPDHLLTVMTRRCDVLRANVGALIMHEGEPVDAFFVLAAGAVTLTQENNSVATVSTTGDTVGLASVLTRRPARATALVVQDAELLRFGAAEFWRLAGTMSELLPAVTKGLVTMLTEHSPVLLVT